MVEFGKTIFFREMNLSRKRLIYFRRIECLLMETACLRRLD